MKSAIELLGQDLLKLLRDRGFVVVHQSPTEKMLKASRRKNEWPENIGAEDYWHRMVGASIDEQNEK